MAINTGAAVKSTNEGFLSPDISVQSDFGLGAQSALLTKEDLKPSQPYQLTTVQDTIPAAPPAAAGAAAVIGVTPHFSSSCLERSAASATVNFDKSSIILFKSGI